MNTVDEIIATVLSNQGRDRDDQLMVVLRPFVEAGYQAGVESQHFDIVTAEERGFALAVQAMQQALPTLRRGDGQLPLDTPIEDLGLTVRAYNCLYRERIRTIGDLLPLSDRQLKDVKNLGRKAMDEIDEKLLAAGYRRLSRD